MQIDVPTLYVLTVGTLCVALAMTLWERRSYPPRADVLGLWAAGYGVLAVGCTVMMNRAAFPGVSGDAATNIVIISGYLLLLHGAARLDGSGRPHLSLIAIGLVAAVWLTLGPHYSFTFWHFGGSVPVALIHFAIVRTLLRSPAARRLRSRPLAIAIASGHGLFYTARFTLVPALAAAYGPDVLVLSAKITMVEAVLYSVAMPMAFVALIREEAQNELLAASRTDYLTGLGNRQALFERGERLLEETTDTVVLLAFDLDHFKSINDRHGHAAGDAVLKLFAKTALASLGLETILARIGGEEFAALLPGTSAAGARLLAEALARAFTEEAARPGGIAIRATVSIGIAESDTQTRDLTSLLSAADRALYSAKSLGRDRVEIAQPVPVPRAA